jgi:hypothetical protein
VHSVGPQRRRPDALADGDAIDRDDLVADESDHACGGDPPQVRQRHGIDQAVHALDRGDRSRNGDDHEHEQPGQVFHAAEPVGVSPGGGSPAHCEGDPQRYRGQCVGEVVHGVGEQRHRTRYQQDGDLGGCGDAEHHEAELDRADARCTVGECVTPVSVVVAVTAVSVVVAVSAVSETEAHQPALPSWMTRSSRSSR